MVQDDPTVGLGERQREKWSLLVWEDTLLGDCTCNELFTVRLGELGKAWGLTTLQLCVILSSDCFFVFSKLIMANFIKGIF